MSPLLGHTDNTDKENKVMRSTKSLAVWNNSLTLDALCPTQSPASNCCALTSTRGTLASAAIAIAREVFPVPLSPTIRTPCTSSIANRLAPVTKSLWKRISTKNENKDLH